MENGQRDVKVLFKKAVAGRQLVTLRLEKNAPAKAGVWKLPVITYPGAKYRRVVGRGRPEWGACVEVTT